MPEKPSAFQQKMTASSLASLVNSAFQGAVTANPHGTVVALVVLSDGANAEVLAELLDTVHEVADEVAKAVADVVADLVKQVANVAADRLGLEGSLSGRRRGSRLLGDGRGRGLDLCGSDSGLGRALGRLGSLGRLLGGRGRGRRAGRVAVVDLGPVNVLEIVGEGVPVDALDGSAALGLSLAAGVEAGVAVVEVGSGGLADGEGAQHDGGRVTHDGYGLVLGCCSEESGEVMQRS
jgi:hypothetical protein